MRVMLEEIERKRRDAADARAEAARRAVTQANAKASKPARPS